MILLARVPLRAALPLIPLAVFTASCHAQSDTDKVKTTTATLPAAAQDLQARIEALKAKTLKNLIKVKGGTFTMGDFGPIHNADKLPYSSAIDDDVLRQVTLDDFSIGAYKVTYEDFDVYTDATGKPRIAQGALDWRMYRDLPNIAAGVSWNDAEAYCQWIGNQVDIPMTLPTEAQWEYAARDRGKFVVYATSNGLIEDGSNVSSFSQYKEFSRKYNKHSDFSSIGLFPPTPLGLYDMIDHGYEWSADWYASAYDPKDTQNPKGPRLGTEKVLRSSSNRGGDSLSRASMTFTRFHRIPAPSPIKDPVDDKPLDGNPNIGNGFRCVTNRS